MGSRRRRPDLLGFSSETDASVRRLVDWLRSGAVQVRRLEGRFPHGKAFLIADGSHGVVAGSSNFTRAGLSANVELNLGNYSPHVVGQVREWFQELWAEAADYDLAALFEGRFEPHPPQLIYLWRPATTPSGRCWRPDGWLSARRWPTGRPPTPTTSRKWTNTSTPTSAGPTTPRSTRRTSCAATSSGTVTCCAHWAMRRAP